MRWNNFRRGEILMASTSKTLPVTSGGSGSASDADLTTSDITTNDASTAKHGFMKKLSNNVGEYLSGTGVWTTVISVALAGLVTTNPTIISSGDSIVGGMGKLQAQVTERLKKNGDLYHREGSEFSIGLLSPFSVTITGTGASSQSGTFGSNGTEDAIGVWQVDTGTTNVGSAAFGTGTATWVVPTLAQYTYEGRHALEAISDGTETFTARLGFGNFYLSTGDSSRGIYFRYSHGVNGGKWQAVLRKASADAETADTGIAGDTIYHIFKITLNEAATIVTFEIDGAVVATMNTLANIPAIADTMGVGAHIVKSAGNTQRNFSTDYLWYEFSRAAER